MTSPKNLEQLKNRIMFDTRTDLANLASFLGYGWCYGVNGRFNGDDMIQQGDSWVSNLKPISGTTVTGVKSDQRLKISYNNWRFKVKSIKFDVPKEDDNLRPVGMFSGYIDNDSGTKTTETVDKTESVARKVSNSVANGFEFSSEAGISITYAAVDVKGSIDFTFNASAETTTTDSAGVTQATKFTIKQSKELEPFTAAKWTMLIKSSRVTVGYTAVVLAEFSVTFDGFLRWGGEDGSKTNYHKDHFRSEARATVPYTFGSATESFTEALKDQSFNKKVPWLWEEAIKNNPGLQAEIDDLTTLNRYEQIIEGNIEDIRATNSSVRWVEVDLKEALVV